jgi:putative ABC transport system ATP-binding protein
MLLKLNNIFKWVNAAGSRQFLLKDIHLEVKEGDFISVMGPSGSGKSTLLNIIGMLDEFNEGEYHFMNDAVHRAERKTKDSDLPKVYRLCISAVPPD